jgi:hypothetical protein
MFGNVSLRGKVTPVSMQIVKGLSGRSFDGRKNAAELRNTN